MSCLEATFTLTPLAPAFSNSAYLFCYGADFFCYGQYSLSSLYKTNRFFFHRDSASDPNLNYALFSNRKKARFLMSDIELSGYEAENKQLALIFGFDVPSSYDPGRVLVYTDGGLIKDQTLAYGDNQFLLEIESLDSAIFLYFIHAGGTWFFRGLSGYVV